MNLSMSKHFAARTALAGLLSLAAWSPARSQSAEPAKPGKMTMDHSKMDHSKMDHAKMGHSKTMMEHCQKMMADMKTQDAEMAAQVARMNGAAKESKVDLMAEILTKMAEQRAAMNAQMAGMHMELMKHMEMGMGPKAHHPMAKDAKPDSPAKVK